MAERNWTTVSFPTTLIFRYHLPLISPSDPDPPLLNSFGSCTPPVSLLSLSEGALHSAWDSHLTSCLVGDGSIKPHRCTCTVRYLQVYCSVHRLRWPEVPLLGPIFAKPTYTTCTCFFVYDAKNKQKTTNYWYLFKINFCSKKDNNDTFPIWHTRNIGVIRVTFVTPLVNRKVKFSVN